MQKTINIILKAALAVVLTVLATGCITDKFDTSKDLRSVMLQVKIATGEMTKAAPTGAESAINSVRIYAYRADGLQAGHFYRPDASTDPIVMDLTLPETGTHNVKFYVIANEASMDFMDDFRFEEDMTQAQLMAAKFHNVIPSNGFPMYCEQTEDINVESVTQTPNTLENHKGHFYLTKEVTFSLVRPMAKLSVYAAIAQGGSSQPISVRGLAYQKNGTRNHNYLLPQTAATLATVPERTRGADMISQSIILTKTVEKTNETALQTPESYDLIVKDHYIGETEVGGRRSLIVGYLFRLFQLSPLVMRLVEFVRRFEEILGNLLIVSLWTAATWRNTSRIIVKCFSCFVVRRFSLLILLMSCFYLCGCRCAAPTATESGTTAAS